MADSVAVREMVLDSHQVTEKIKKSVGLLWAGALTKIVNITGWILMVGWMSFLTFWRPI